MATTAVVRPASTTDALISLALAVTEADGPEAVGLACRDFLRRTVLSTSPPDVGLASLRQPPLHLRIDLAVGDAVVDWPLPGFADWGVEPSPCRPWTVATSGLFALDKSRLPVSVWLEQPLLAADGRAVSLGAGLVGPSPVDDLLIFGVPYRGILALATDGHVVPALGGSRLPPAIFARLPEDVPFPWLTADRASRLRWVAGW